MQRRHSTLPVSYTHLAQEGIYISDIIVEENMVTLNRVTKEGEIYTGTSQDYITSNEERLSLIHIFAKRAADEIEKRGGKDE